MAATYALGITGRVVSMGTMVRREKKWKKIAEYNEEPKGNLDVIQQ